MKLQFIAEKIEQGSGLDGLREPSGNGFLYNAARALTATLLHGNTRGINRAFSNIVPP